MSASKLRWEPEQQEYPASDEYALILSQEHETHVQATITATPAQQTPSPKILTWQAPEGLPPHITITAVTAENNQKACLNIAVADWMGLFDIEINYMQDGPGVGIGQTPHTVNQWGTVPDTVADVYAYYPSQKNVYRLPLVVKAYATADTSKEPIEQVIYTITVYANYDLGKNALKHALQARSDTTGV